MWACDFLGYLCFCSDCIDHVFSGGNALVFSYGPTNAGKTYTIEGTANAPGVLVRTLQTLFDAIQERSETKTSVWVSYLEVYNESIFDLLTEPEKDPIGRPLPRKQLRLKEESGNVVVKGLRELAITSVAEGVQVFFTTCLYA